MGRVGTGRKISKSYRHDGFYIAVDWWFGPGYVTNIYALRARIGDSDARGVLAAGIINTAYGHLAGV